MKRFAIEKLIWVALVGVMGWVVFRFVALDRQRLPVLGQVSGFRFTNQLGTVVTRESLLGHIWVANVIFSRCPTQCHRLSLQMARLQNGLPESAQVRLISFTADPAFDSPQVLANYGQRYGADPSRWWFLTGDKAEIYRTAIKDLGFTVVENSATNVPMEDLFLHSAFFAVVDGQGRLRAIVQGERPRTEYDLAALINRLAREN